MMPGRLNSSDRIGRAVALLRRARKMGTAEAAAEADLSLAGLTRDQLRQVLSRAGEAAPSAPRLAASGRFSES